VTANEAFQAPKGTADTLPPESGRWEEIVTRFAGIARRAGYGLVLNPMFEDVRVFKRGVGESTDIVTKEMYEFEDKGGRKLALRPEGTAPVIRAFVQHRPTVPWKVWYVTPAFRQENPQAGRYRQHHQLGVEAVGTDDPDVDVEVIAILGELFKSVGLQRFELRLNSMGDSVCMPGYKASLVAYLEGHESELCDEHRGRWRLNPLRIFDCKKPECVAVRAGAPRIRDALCDPCRAHFQRVQEGLTAVGFEYRLDDYLVRGFDYYTRTTFEFASLALESAQNAIGGGGRYDGLAELLGGPQTPGIGFGSGIERILLACDAEGVFSAPGSRVDAFVVDVTGGAEARDLSHELRGEGFAVDRSFGQRSMKAQMKAANNSGARVALIIGEDEAASKAVSLKPLRGDGPHEQEIVKRSDVARRLREVLDRASSTDD
jgi:histidyl-tRNA synthetase